MHVLKIIIALNYPKVSVKAHQQHNGKHVSFHPGNPIFKFDVRKACCYIFWIAVCLHVMHYITKETFVFNLQ